MELALKNGRNNIGQLWNEAVESGLEAAHTQTAENKKAATVGGVIGYVFTDIENVTKSQGSPKTKSGISQSTFSDINTVAQLYKTVKGIDRKNGGLKYGADTQNMLFYYTETEKGKKYSDRFTKIDRDYLSAVKRHLLSRELHVRLAPPSILFLMNKEKRIKNSE